MTRSEERELFLRYLSDMYIQNPKFPFSVDTVYNELSRFCVCNREQYFVDNESLVGVQVKLNNRYRSNGKVNTFCDDYFWYVDNRSGRKENEFLSDMYNSIKLYISVDANDMYKISTLLFDFMIKEGIVMRSKIAKGMRNDALVCRVKDKEDALKVSGYLNSLNYKSDVKPNPFIYDNGKVSITKDGHLSYNRVLSKLIFEYLSLKKNTNSLDNISNNDLGNFIINQIDMLKSDQKKSYIDLYEIDGNDKYKDFIMISSIIYKNLNDNMNLDELFTYKDFKDVFLDELEFISFDSEEVKMKYVIYSLATYYSVEEVHNRIMKFIDTGDYTLFTREGDKNIRAIMYNNFSPTDTLEIISRIGWKALVDVSRTTYNKCGEEQLFLAVKELFNGDGMSSFTNDDYARSRLGLVIPPELLRKVMISKLNQNGKSISSISVAELVLEEINVMEEKKSNGRK